MEYLVAGKLYDVTTYCGQVQSPVFISWTFDTRASWLGPSALHLRHCALREKFIKSHLQQVNVRIRSDIKRKKKEDEGGLLQLGVQITRGGDPLLPQGLAVIEVLVVRFLKRLPNLIRRKKKLGTLTIQSESRPLIGWKASLWSPPIILRQNYWVHIKHTGKTQTHKAK